VTPTTKTHLKPLNRARAVRKEEGVERLGDGGVRWCEVHQQRYGRVAA
jgi:hypothetical protein